MIERMRLRRAHDAGISKCVCVLIIGELRYEQDQSGLSWPNIRYSFPDRGASEEVLLEWANRVISKV
jgi:hypothetical protein